MNPLGGNESNGKGCNLVYFVNNLRSNSTYLLIINYFSANLISSINSFVSAIQKFLQKSEIGKLGDILYCRMTFICPAK